MLHWLLVHFCTEQCRDPAITTTLLLPLELQLQSHLCSVCSQSFLKHLWKQFGRSDHKNLNQMPSCLKSDASGWSQQRLDFLADPNRSIWVYWAIFVCPLKVWEAESRSCVWICPLCSEWCTVCSSQSKHTGLFLHPSYMFALRFHRGALT